VTKPGIWTLRVWALGPKLRFQREGECDGRTSYTCMQIECQNCLIKGGGVQKRVTERVIKICIYGNIE
jgi:hypothetical protein